MEKLPSELSRHGKQLQDKAFDLETIRTSISKLFQKSKQSEGQGLVEYALVLMLVALVVIAALVVLGPQIGSMFSAVTKGLK